MRGDDVGDRWGGGDVPDRYRRVEPRRQPRGGVPYVGGGGRVAGAGGGQYQGVTGTPAGRDGPVRQRRQYRRVGAERRGEDRVVPGRGELRGQVVPHVVPGGEECGQYDRRAGHLGEDVGQPRPAHVRVRHRYRPADPFGEPRGDPFRGTDPRGAPGAVHDQYRGGVSHPAHRAASR